MKDKPSLSDIKNNLLYEVETGNLIWIKRNSNRIKLGDIAGSISKRDGYTHIRLNGISICAHHLVWAINYGEYPIKEIDHINRIRSDNRIENLRLATRGQNAKNCGLSKRNKSGVKGVSWHKKAQKWSAEWKKDGKKYYLGLFINLEDAAKACREKEIELYPEICGTQIYKNMIVNI